MRKKNILLSGITFLALVLAAGCGGQKNSAHDDHKGHSEAEHASEAPDAHAGEVPDAHAGETADAHEGEGEIVLTPEAVAMAGITLAKVGMGTIRSTIDLSGEV